MTGKVNAIFVTTAELGAVLGISARTVRRRVEAKHPRFAAYHTHQGAVPMLGEHLRFTPAVAVAIAEAHGFWRGRTVARWRRQAEAIGLLNATRSRSNA
jgi:hypothetical protein